MSFDSILNQRVGLKSCQGKALRMHRMCSCGAGLRQPTAVCSKSEHPRLVWALYLSEITAGLRLLQGTNGQLIYSSGGLLCWNLVREVPSLVKFAFGVCPCAKKPCKTCNSVLKMAYLSNCVCFKGSFSLSLPWLWWCRRYCGLVLACADH